MKVIGEDFQGRPIYYNRPQTRVRSTSTLAASDCVAHASIKLTLNTHSHVLPTMQKRAAERMEGTLKQAIS
jgi:hypothetical protein